MTACPAALLRGRPLPCCSCSSRLTWSFCADPGRQFARAAAHPRLRAQPAKRRSSRCWCRRATRRPISKPACAGCWPRTIPAFEVLVLDDQSTRRHRRDPGRGWPPRTRGCGCCTGGPLLPGWLGKANACRQLAEAARGDLLLFTDADVRHAPALLGHAVRRAGALDVGLLSIFPAQITGTWAERLIVPLMQHFAVYALLPLPLMRRLRAPAFAAANGEFLLFRRAAYCACGGHAAVRRTVLEDVGLARAVKAGGLPHRAGRRRRAGRLPHVPQRRPRSGPASPRTCSPSSIAPGLPGRGRAAGLAGLWACRRSRAGGVSGRPAAWEQAPPWAWVAPAAGGIRRRRGDAPGAGAALRRARRGHVPASAGHGDSGGHRGQFGAAGAGRPGRLEGPPPRLTRRPPRPIIPLELRRAPAAPRRSLPCR